MVASGEHNCGWFGQTYNIVLVVLVHLLDVGVDERLLSVWALDLEFFLAALES